MSTGRSHAGQGIDTQRSEAMASILPPGTRPRQRPAPAASVRGNGGDRGVGGIGGREEDAREVVDPDLGGGRAARRICLWVAVILPDEVVAAERVGDHDGFRALEAELLE